jgi:AraC-like DNA-binding protein
MDQAVVIGRSADDRDLDHLRTALLEGPCPFLLNPQRVDGHAARLRLRQVAIADARVGSVHLSLGAACEVRRTPKLIRRSDSRYVCLAMPVAGTLTMDQEGKQSLVHPGEMTIYHTSRPYDGVFDSVGGSGEAVFAAVPRDCLPTPDRWLRELNATVLQVPAPLTRLALACLARLTADASDYPAAAASHLDGIVIELITTVLAAASAGESWVAAADPQRQRRLLLVQAQAYIDHNLHDPRLSPASIADALHVSLRTLYRAFDQHEVSAAQWIRHQRLERCRRDLLDAAQATTPVGTLAGRWGFSDAAQFGRAFRRAFGSPPGAYRRARLSDHPDADRRDDGTQC